MSALKGYRPVALVAVLATLAGCATNRIARCEGHLVPINPPPPKLALGAPPHESKSAPSRSAEKRP